MTRLQEVEKLLDNNLQLITDYTKRAAELIGSVRQLAEWLTELKQWRRVYGVCPSYEMCIPECKEGYNAQIAEYKRLLKAAVEDLSCGGENNKCTKSCKTCTYNSIKGYGCRYFGEYHWRYAAEALALIGGETDEQI